MEMAAKKADSELREERLIQGCNENGRSVEQCLNINVIKRYQTTRILPHHVLRSRRNMKYIRKNNGSNVDAVIAKEYQPPKYSDAYHRPRRGQNIKATAVTEEGGDESKENIDG